MKKLLVALAIGVTSLAAGATAAGAAQNMGDLTVDPAAPRPAASVLASARARSMLARRSARTSGAAITTPSGKA